MLSATFIFLAVSVWLTSATVTVNILHTEDLRGTLRPWDGGNACTPPYGVDCVGGIERRKSKQTFLLIWTGIVVKFR